MRKNPIASAAAVALLTVVMGLVTGVVSAWADEPAAVSEADLTYFYKNPSPTLAARLITYLDVLGAAEKPASRPPLMGFFAGVFQRYPAVIDAMIPASVSAPMMELLAVSLRLAGQQARAESMIGKLKARDAVVPDLTAVPSNLDGPEPGRKLRGEVHLDGRSVGRRPVELSGERSGGVDHHEIAFVQEPRQLGKV